MFQNDYLMRIIMQFVAALQRALNAQNLTPEEKAESLEQAVGDATGIDPQLLLSMDPASVVSMLQLGDFDERMGGYALRSLYLEADILEENGNQTLADLRREQADAISQAYGLDVTRDDVTPEALEQFLAEEASEE